MKFLSLSLLSVTALSTFVSAGPLAAMDQLRMFSPTEPELRLIKYGDDTPAKWMTEGDKEALFRAGVKFMDITDYPNPVVSTLNSAWTPYIPSKAQYQDEVTPFIGNLTTDFMKETLTTFTGFRNRYYKSSYGAKSCRWLIQQIRDVAEGTGHVSVKEFEHSWDQFSIVARFEGTNKDLKDELVIVGAHQDSVNMWLPSFGRSPGADDDGSGTVTILEAFRSLVHNGFKPERPVEFHWYSGEEAGLLGSQAVSRKYKEDGKRIVAMLQNDMTGYVSNKDNEVIGIITDHVDEKLTDFLKTLVDNYADIPYTLTKCGYACSDHASWREVGFPSAFTIESSFDDSNKFIHGTGDTIDKLSFDHMKQFAQVAVGFAVELSHVRD